MRDKDGEGNRDRSRKAPMCLAKTFGFYPENS